MKSEGQSEKANLIQNIYEKPKEELATKLNNIMEGNKRAKDFVMPTEKAAACQVYMDWSRNKYQYIKNLTDDVIPIFPSWKKTKIERDKCIAKDLKVEETLATASVTATMHNYTGRIVEDEDINPVLNQLADEHGEKLKLKELYKTGTDGTTTKQYKVRNDYYNINVQMKHISYFFCCSISFSFLEFF